MDETAPRTDEKLTGSSTTSSRYVTCSKRKRRSSGSSDNEEFIVRSTQLSPVDIRTACFTANEYSSIKKAQLDLLKSGLDSDFKIVCGGHTWKVHSSVLAPRWDYLRAIFDLKVRSDKRYSCYKPVLTKFVGMRRSRELALWRLCRYQRYVEVPLHA